MRTQFSSEAMAKLAAGYVVGSSGDCWEWRGRTNNARYGYLWLDGAQWLAHRAAWAAVNGPIPVGLYICHRCDNPLCVNPNHLFLGSPQENTQDSIAKGRSMGHPPAEARRKPRLRALADDTVRAIRQATGTQEEIAQRFNVSRPYVSELRSGKRKAHVSA